LIIRYQGRHGFHALVADKLRILSNIGIPASTQTAESHCDCMGVWQ